METPEPMTEDMLDNIGICLEHGGGVSEYDHDRTIRELYAEVRRLRAAMQEAYDHCETCRGETDPDRRCARCLTFEKLLRGE